MGPEPGGGKAGSGIRSLKHKQALQEKSPGKGPRRGTQGREGPQESNPGRGTPGEGPRGGESSREGPQERNPGRRTPGEEPGGARDPRRGTRGREGPRRGTPGEEPQERDPGERNPAERDPRRGNLGEGPQERSPRERDPRKGIQGGRTPGRGLCSGPRDPPHTRSQAILSGCLFSQRRSPNSLRHILLFQISIFKIQLFFSRAIWFLFSASICVFKSFGLFWNSSSGGCRGPLCWEVPLCDRISPDVVTRAGAHLPGPLYLQESHLSNGMVASRGFLKTYFASVEMLRFSSVQTSFVLCFDSGLHPTLSHFWDQGPVRASSLALS